MDGGPGDLGEARTILSLGLLFAAAFAAFLAGVFAQKHTARIKRNEVAARIHKAVAERIIDARRAGDWGMIDAAKRIEIELESHLSGARGLMRDLDKKLKAATSVFEDKAKAAHHPEPHGPPTPQGAPPVANSVVVTVNHGAPAADGHGASHASHDGRGHGGHGHSGAEHEPTLAERRQKIREAIDDLGRYWNASDQRIAELIRAQNELAGEI